MGHYLNVLIQQLPHEPITGLFLLFFCFFVSAIHILWPDHSRLAQCEADKARKRRERGVVEVLRDNITTINL